MSGPSLPDATPHENSSTVITNTFKDHLKLNISVSDINAAHRIGPANSQRKRPIIVKLQKNPEARPGWGLYPNEASTVHQREPDTQTTHSLQAGVKYPTSTQEQIPAMPHQGWKNNCQAQELCHQA